MYCIFTQLTNSNVLGKSPIRDSNTRETGNCNWWIWQKYNTHVTVKDHIYEYTLTNTDNELYCYSNEFHSHLPFDRPWSELSEKDLKYGIGYRACPPPPPEYFETCIKCIPTVFLHSFFNFCLIKKFFCLMIGRYISIKS